MASKPQPAQTELALAKINREGVRKMAGLSGAPPEDPLLFSPLCKIVEAGNGRIRSSTYFPFPASVDNGI